MATITRKCGRCHNKLDLSYFTGDMTSCDKCSIYGREHDLIYREHTNDNIS